MPLAVSDDHHALAEVARGFLAEHGALAAARTTLEAPAEARPAFWGAMAEIGWMGLHLPEEHGGQGFGLAELAVVVEAMGASVTPGPFLATVVAAAVIDRCGTEAQRAAWLPGLASGSLAAAVGFGSSSVERSGNALRGDAGWLLGVGTADIVLIATGDDLAIVPRGATGLAVEPGNSLDTTRRLTRVRCDGAVAADDAIVRGGRIEALRVGRALAAAEAAGGARTCVDMAVAYAKVREQFGRAIGSFQAIKHHCAEMLVDAELAAAVAWDANRLIDTDAPSQLSAAVAATQALPGFQRCAQKNIQIHGGIGYTWEHDAHLYLRRAASLVAIFGSDGDGAREVAAVREAGVEPRLSVDLPPEAETYRAEARDFLARHDALAGQARKDLLVDSGYFVPHWPTPWGRAAGAIEQLVIDEELPAVEQPKLGIGGWVMLTIVQHARPDQAARWVRPSLMGELRWCQLFSEPNAGSDAAAITTRAIEAPGGWKVNGQKVWTSGAQDCNMGLATVRTDPSAPKHAGVSTFAIDLTAPGVEIRPLRELTGECLFNEVFFDDVFVPDDDVVGEVDAGWTVARATLGNERVSIGGNKGNLDLVEADDLIALLSDHAPHDPGAAAAVGVLLAENHAMSVMNLRQIVRALIGGPPGPEGNITKLLSAEHAQRVAELGLRLIGTGAVAGTAPEVAHSYLFTRCLTIAGGTSEIVRNLIAERILGLPRERMA